eukprot:scaffold4612_cov88-Isochrysis_galbana.AAC.2
MWCRVRPVSWSPPGRYLDGPSSDPPIECRDWRAASERRGAGEWVGRVPSGEGVARLAGVQGQIPGGMEGAQTQVYAQPETGSEETSRG